MAEGYIVIVGVVVVLVLLTWRFGTKSPRRNIPDPQDEAESGRSWSGVFTRNRPPKAQEPDPDNDLNR